jgi:hypothetical protein
MGGGATHHEGTKPSKGMHWGRSHTREEAQQGRNQLGKKARHVRTHQGRAGGANAWGEVDVGDGN